MIPDGGILFDFQVKVGKMFGGSNTSFGSGGLGLSMLSNTSLTTSNPNKDIQVVSPPDDSISSLAFSPASTQPNIFLVAGSWDNHVSSSSLLFLERISCMEC